MLEQIAFQDRTAAVFRLSRLNEHLEEGLPARLEVLLASCADPDSALYFLECLQARQPEAFRRLTSNPTALQHLLTVFSHSRFLSEELLEHPEWVDELVERGVMHRVLSVEEYIGQLEEWLGHAPGTPSPLSLALFRRKQILRILLRDVLGFASLSEVTGELSNLADAILDVAYHGIRQDLEQRYGKPQCIDASGRKVECGFTVLALGKLGGDELNYSSDIDLMFIYGGNGETDGPTSISNKEFFKKVANTYTELLSTYTAEGMCYRVDLRLRPDGRHGEVCVSLDGAKSYYQSRARDWELQMLIKARCAAGEPGPGRELLEFVDPLIYSTTLDFGAVEAVSEARERIHEKLAARRGNTGFDVKLARGGIRDIEFLVQCLQRLHGGRVPWVRHGGTLLALARLNDKELLSDSEYSRLASAYTFLRNIEHRLQFDEDRQTHMLPATAKGLDLLARRMPAGSLGGDPTGDLLRRRLNTHLEEVQDIYQRVIHAQNPTYYRTAADRTHEAAAIAVASITEPVASNLVRYLDQKAPRLAAQLARRKLRGAVQLEHFLERVDDQPELLAWLDADPVLTGYVLTVFDLSPYLADEMIRTPQLIEEIRSLRDRRDVDVRYHELAGVLDEPGDLRRFFRREMFRLQVESICLPVPVFTTLQRTSTLADAVIAAAYRMALNSVIASNPPSDPLYEPRDQMMVIALGRLGLKEFDLASDADLVFVLPDADTKEELFWTRVAERMINIITAYTKDGVMFAVDTRLRPNGREGPLVQSETAFKNYFASHAEAWEGITYMKSRAIAGDIEKGTAFLGELQKVDWRRYGQSGRSRRLLHQMRMRLEREQGPSNPLKAGYGGYYDIDFALMYLRLKGAGIFFKVLNTPERIDVIEQMGHLERADAEFLRDAATLYRAIDHGLRVFSGQAQGSLPTAESHLEILTKLVALWTPDHLHDQDLPTELSQVQRRTREFFDRLFQ